MDQRSQLQALPCGVTELQGRPGAEVSESCVSASEPISIETTATTANVLEIFKGAGKFLPMLGFRVARLSFCRR